MKPTPKTYWYFIQARTEGAMAAQCQRAQLYNMAARHADQAKLHWHKIEWAK